MEKDKKEAVILKPETTVTPVELLQMAIEKGVDVDQLEKFMALYEKWEAKQANKAFISAKVGFHAECPDMKKSKQVAYKTSGGHLIQYDYVPIGDIIKKIRAPLQNNGLSFRWETKDENNLITITCILSHVDGHSESNSMQGAYDNSGNKNQIQQKASTITYLQRYTLKGILGLGDIDDDDDGQGGEAKPEPKVKELPELTPKHKRWDGACDGLSKETITIADIKRNYNLSSKNEVLLEEYIPEKK